MGTLNGFISLIHILLIFGYSPTHSIPSSSVPISADKLNLLTFSDAPLDKNSPNKNVITKYQKIGHLLVYKFTDDSKCYEVKYDDVSIWRHDYQIHGNDYPIKVVLNITARAIWIILNKLYYGYMQHGDVWKLNLVKHQSQLTDPPEDETRLYTKDVNPRASLAISEPNNELLDLFSEMKRKQKALSSTPDYASNSASASPASAYSYNSLPAFSSKTKPKPKPKVPPKPMYKPIYNPGYTPAAAAAAASASAYPYPSASASASAFPSSSASASELCKASYNYKQLLKTHIAKKLRLERELYEKEKELERLLQNEKDVLIKYIKGRNLSLWVGTWNIGGRNIDLNENIMDWAQLKDKKHDVYVFNFQEHVELSVLNIATGKTDQVKEGNFEQFIETMLKVSTGHEYMKLKSVSMIGLYTVIFVRKLIGEYIRDVVETRVKTGLYYNMGNKGAIGIRFKLFEYSFSFLNAHLNFGKSFTLRRIALLEYVLDNSFSEYNETVVNDSVFVLAGDFNFHVNLERETLLKLLKNMEYAKLMNYDEFNMAKMNSVSILNKLHESRIRFHPTYKYLDGTKYFTQDRCPGWCDRILFGGQLPELNKAVALSYRGNDKLISSDHRAVSLSLSVDFEQ